MSFGSVVGAIISLRNNKRKSKRKHGSLPGPSKSHNTGIKSHRTPSREELQKLRQNLQKEHQNRQLKIIVISAVFFILFVAGFFYVMF